VSTTEEDDTVTSMEVEGEDDTTLYIEFPKTLVADGENKDVKVLVDAKVPKEHDLFIVHTTNFCREPLSLNSCFQVERFWNMIQVNNYTLTLLFNCLCLFPSLCIEENRMTVEKSLLQS
jgi:hypothetical protein